MAKCWNCGKEYEPEGKIMRDAECPHCAAWLRCCRNCQFYQVGLPNDCREPQADLQPDKEAANACDYFRALGTGKAGGPKKGKMDFDGLFKD
jgi:hypothetical protein